MIYYALDHIKGCRDYSRKQKNFHPPKLYSLWRQRLKEIITNCDSGQNNQEPLREYDKEPSFR